MDITPLQNNQVDFMWNRVKSYFKAAADETGGRYTANDIRMELKRTPSENLFIAHEGEDVYGFVVTSLVDYPQLRSLNLRHTAGKELSLWKNDMLQHLREFASNNGCEIIESIGRAGWEKVFKEDGYIKTSTAYTLPVGGEK